MLLHCDVLSRLLPGIRQHCCTPDVVLDVGILLPCKPILHTAIFSPAAFVPGIVCVVLNAGILLPDKPNADETVLLYTAYLVLNVGILLPGKPNPNEAAAVDARQELDLKVSYAMSGTDMLYAVRCPVLA